MENSSMGQEDWARQYAEMDQRLQLKYKDLPNGEQIGKKPEPPKHEASKSSDSPRVPSQKQF